MRSRVWPALLAVVAATACSSEPDRQWMKAGPYTVEEFQRDTAACTKKGNLDAECMQSRGWIAVQPDKAPESAKRQSSGRTYQVPTVR
jgi:hypothetical protein